MPRRVIRRAIDDRLPAGGRAVVHRGVGDLAAVEPRDLGLELEQGLERALGDLGLVGRVAGQELAALDEMIDAGRNMVAIGAAAEEEGHVAGGDIAPRQRAELALDAELAGMIGQALDRRRRAAPPRARRRTDRRSSRAPISARASRCRSASLGKWQITHVRFLQHPTPASASRSAAAHNRRRPAPVGLAQRRRDPRLDRGGDVVALPFGHHRHVHHAGAEGLDPVGDAARQRRRPRDQLGADVGEAGDAIEPGELLDAGIPGRVLLRHRDSRARSARRAAPRRRVARLPSPPISPTKRPPAFSAAKMPVATASGSSIQCRAALEKTASNWPNRSRSIASASATKASMPRARAASTISGELSRPITLRARRDDPLGQRAVAAADVEDQLAGLRREQLQHRVAERRHEGGILRIIGRRPAGGDVHHRRQSCSSQ